MVSITAVTNQKQFISSVFLANSNGFDDCVIIRRANAGPDKAGVLIELG
jgi:hypothetical protein